MFLHAWFSACSGFPPKSVGDLGWELPLMFGQASEDVAALLFGGASSSKIVQVKGAAVSTNKKLAASGATFFKLPMRTLSFSSNN